MKKLLISLSVLAPAIILATSCSVTRTAYTPAYTGAYVTATTTTVAPNLDYVGYGFDSWYGGTPDYYNTSLYIGDW